MQIFCIVTLATAAFAVVTICGMLVALHTNK